MLGIKSDCFDINTSTILSFTLFLLIIECMSATALIKLSEFCSSISLCFISLSIVALSMLAGFEVLIKKVADINIMKLDNKTDTNSTFL